MSIEKEDLPCIGKRLNFIRSVSLNLSRICYDDVLIIEDLKNDCENILQYDFEIEGFPGAAQNMFMLHIGTMVLLILPLEDDCIVIKVVNIIDQKELENLPKYNTGV